MTIAEPNTPASAIAPPPPSSRRRVAIASFMGTLIELYDFVIYGTAAALVFPKILFPALGSAAALVVSFATFGVAFVARPIGGMIFGHFGDRLGRKKTLVITLVSMGTATVLIGLVPTAAQIGVAAPIFLVLMRIVQGLAQGGEWAGATLFATEHAPKEKRGRWAMFPLLGGTLATSLASATFLVTGLWMSNETFVSWGWRIPFLASAVLLVIGLWIRLQIEETPVFKGEMQRSGGARFPFVEAFKRQPKEILLVAGIGLTSFPITYVTGTYMTAYATTNLGLSRTEVLAALVVGGLVLSAGMVLTSILSDRVGRRPILLTTSAVGVVLWLAAFPILEHGGALTFAALLCVLLFLNGANYGPLGSFIPELFQTRYRYTATGISYNLGTLIGGGVAPLLAPIIVASHGTFAYGDFLSGLCVVAILCTLALRETKDSNMDRAEARVAAGV